LKPYNLAKARLFFSVDVIENRGLGIEAVQLAVPEVIAESFLLIAVSSRSPTT
jgi:hypothetical protein